MGLGLALQGKWPASGGALRPDARPQLAQLISQARHRDESIGPPGATHRWNLSSLNSIISLSPPDMILTVETGLTLQQVKDAVENEHLWLPLDTTDGGQVTLASYLSADYSLSWLSHRYGTSRDWVMGMTVCDDQGREVTSGAAVVKNVAGYQLAPLYIGARDALGPIVEVSFRLLPLPARLTHAHWESDTLAPLQRIRQQARSSSHPDGRAEPWEALRLARYGARWQLEGLTRFPPEAAASWGPRDGSGTITEVDRPARESLPAGFHPALRLQVLPTQLPPLLDAVARQGPDLVCYPSLGVLTLGGPGGGLGNSAVAKLAAEVVAGGGSARALDPSGSAALPNSDAGAGDGQIMRRVKTILDPHGVFGPWPE